MQDLYPEEHFVGRKSELVALQRWFNDPEAPWLLYIHDAVEDPTKKGGVGKTWLLQRFADYIRQKQRDVVVVRIDFFSVSDRDRLFLAQKIVHALEQQYPEWRASTLAQTVQFYLNRAKISPQGSEDLEEKYREEISAALMEDLRRLDASLAVNQRALLVIFDTFEIIEPNPQVAVLRPKQTFPDTYQFSHMRTIIAGRNQIDWSHPNWQGREQEVQVMPLGPFSPLEMQEYVEAEVVGEVPFDEQRRKALYERTEGRPIILGLAIDVVNNHIQSFDELVRVPQEEFESSLVPQINKLENPLNLVILFMAHVYHRFNYPLLECILQHVPSVKSAKMISPDVLPDLLSKLSFVRRAEDNLGFVLHDEMRRLVTKYCWEVQDRDRRFRKEISSSVIAYFEEKLAEAPNNQQIQRYALRIVYHRLFIDPEQGLRYFHSQLSNALNLSRTAFARLLLQEARSLTEIMTPEQQNDVLLAEVRILREERDPAPALAILAHLRAKASAQWCTQHELDLLREEGRCYRMQGHLMEAEDRYTQCLNIVQARNDEKQSAYYLTHLGNIARQRGEFMTALTYYEQTMAVYRKLRLQKEYVTLLLNTATCYRRLGNFDEASQRGKAALQLRLSLYQGEKISEVLVGIALNVLGQIYLDAGDIVKAEQYFNEAFDIFQRANAKADIAMIYNRFGTVQLAKGELESALAWFAKCAATSESIDQELYINSLNKQGRVLLRQHHREQAISFFEQAIEIAHSVPDHFQETECLIDLADALEQLGQQERAHQCLEEAEMLARQDNYNRLLAQIELQRAQALYKKSDYVQAFHHFARYSRYMLDYNDASFNRSIQTVVDALLAIPKKDVPVMVQELRSYQKEQQLGNDYFKLIQACEKIDDFMIQWMN